MKNKISWLVLLVWASSALLPQQLFASPMAPAMFAVESMVPHTPFDSRLQAAGFFDMAQSNAPRENVDLETLFMEARSFRYTADVPADRWQSPEETARRHSGDCEDKALWLYARLKQAGFSQVRLVIGRFRSIDTTLHAWVIVQQGNSLLVLDPVAQKRIWTLQDFSPKEYYLPLFSFSGTHRYGHALLPAPSL